MTLSTTGSTDSASSNEHELVPGAPPGSPSGSPPVARITPPRFASIGLSTVRVLSEVLKSSGLLLAGGGIASLKGDPSDPVNIARATSLMVGGGVAHVVGRSMDPGDPVFYREDGAVAMARLTAKALRQAESLGNRLRDLPGAARQRIGIQAPQFSTTNSDVLVTIEMEEGLHVPPPAPPSPSLPPPAFLASRGDLRRTSV